MSGDHGRREPPSANYAGPNPSAPIGEHLHRPLNDRQAESVRGGRAVCRPVTGIHGPARAMHVAGGVTPQIGLPRAPPMSVCGILAGAMSESTTPDLVELSRVSTMPRGERTLTRSCAATLPMPSGT